MLGLCGRSKTHAILLTAVPVQSDETHFQVPVLSLILFWAGQVLVF